MKAGWQTKTLGEICTIKGGKRVPKGYKLKTEPTPHPYISVSDFTEDGTVSKAKMKYVDPDIFEQIKRYTITSNDLYLSIAGTIGKTGFVPPELSGASLTENACKLVLGPEVDKEFLYHVTRSGIFSEHVENNTRTAAQPKLSLERLKTIPIPLPPLEEQQRIVAVLDEAFEGLARARAHAEANLQNARELFETSLSAFIDRHKDSWSSTTLGEAYDVRDGTHDSPKYHATGRALITSKNLGRDGLHFEKVKYISEEDYVSISRRSGVDKGDVLFAMIGTIGNPIVVDVEPNFAIKNVALFKMKEGRSGQFLRYVLRSKYVVEKMHAEAKGTTQQFVGLGHLRSFPVILPDPIVESTMVDELDRIEAQCRSAEALYEINIQDLDDLRQSLLQKAFAGELT